MWSRTGGSGAGPRVLRHALRQERTRLTVVAGIMALYVAAQAIGYRDTYPTTAERLRFAAAFEDSMALRIFYGIPRDLATVAGYVEFRTVGLLAVLCSVWAVFAAVRGLRGQEDSGCYELILAGSITRRGAVLATVAALAIECTALWAVTAIALAAAAVPEGDMTAGQAVLVAAAIVAPAGVFIGVGAVASQLAPTHRGAQATGGVLIAGSLLLRIVADLAHGGGPVRWATPLGWAENLRPTTGARPAVLAVFALAAGVLVTLAVTLAERRDVGTSIVRGRVETPSRMYLLGAPWQAALRGEIGTLLAWAAGLGTFALALGAFARSIADEARKSGFHRIGAHIALTTAAGYLAVVFLLFSLVVALFAASHIGGLRDEEASGRLETLTALPVSRRGWIGGRIALAAATSTGLALLAGVLAWSGSTMTGGGVALVSLFEAGANCIPVALLFLGIGLLLFALIPRQSPGAALAAIGVAFLWELVGALVRAPGWLLTVSPFNHVAAVPLAPLDVPGTLTMLACAAITAGLAVEVFARRDLQTG